MSELTPKQERFAHEYIATSNASEAYRRAYDTDSMAPETIRVEACRLLKHHNVALMVQRLQGEASEAAKVTAEGHLLDLKRIRDAAFEAGSYSAAAKAE